ncbi:MAG: D-glycero-alpha-D-manno-heptose 7-phosphate kinase [candidate division WS2 bacterium]|nr:D-glycero-alpha-D-manno-heptose 7-phosphate kinase [Candidatus Lithacetigena glycinireducens]
MIITQTPLRISLFGGSTDFREFYLKECGAVLSLTIDKYVYYVYIIVKERFDDKIYINYSKKEIIDNVDEIQHDLVREAMRKTGITKGVEITTLADVPSEGSGLGSSSSVTVGLLNVFYAYQGEQVTQERLTREACEIEIDILKNPIGIQDQYIASYGNLRFLSLGKIGVSLLKGLKFLMK